MIGRVLFAVAALAGLAGAAPLDLAQPISMTAEGLRSAKGRILICVARSADYFPDCSKDPDKRHLIVATTGNAIPLGNLAPGDYAIAIIHDENGNGKLDTFAGIPREGYGFSRNPGFKPRAPTFAETQISVSGAAETQIRMRYIL